MTPTVDICGSKGEDGAQGQKSECTIDTKTERRFVTIGTIEFQSNFVPADFSVYQSTSVQISVSLCSCYMGAYYSCPREKKFRDMIVKELLVS